MHVNREWIVLGGVVVWAAVLRFWGLGHASVWLDEAISIYAAAMIHEHGLPVFASGLYLQGFLQSYLLAFVGVFSWGEWWMRAPSALAGVLLVFVVYVASREVYSRRVAVMSSLAVAVSYWLVAWSRQARMYVFLTLFAVLALWMLYRFISERRARDGVLLAVSCVACVLLHGFGAVIAAFCLVLVLVCVRIPPRWQIPVGVLGGVLAVFVVRALVSLSFEMNYFSGYASWLFGEFAVLVLLAPLAVLLGVKERWVVALLLSYLVALSFFVPLFHYRYLVWTIPLLLVLSFAVLDRFIAGWWYYVVAGLVIVGTPVLWVAQSDVFLEPLTPQPPWREVYASLPEGHHVDAHPVIAWYYGRVPDGWFANSLTGRRAPGAHDGYLGIPAAEWEDVLVVDDRSLASVGARVPENSVVFGSRYWSRAYVARMPTPT